MQDFDAAAVTSTFSNVHLDGDAPTLGHALSVGAAVDFRYLMIMSQPHASFFPTGPDPVDYETMLNRMLNVNGVYRLQAFQNDQHILNQFLGLTSWSVVPEPSTALMAGLGLASLSRRSRRRVRAC